MVKHIASRSRQLELVFFNFNTWLLIIVLVLLLLALNLALTFWQPIGDDVPVYHYFAQNIWAGLIPYKDIQFEYPPGALPFILLARPLGMIMGQYESGFLLLSAFALTIFIRSLYVRQGLKIVLTFSILAIPATLFFFGYLEIFAALALYGSILLFNQKRYDFTAILLASSVLIKFYPIVCLPVLLIFLPKSSIKRFLAIFLGVLAVGCLPFIFASPAGFWHSITYHSGRPVQVESGVAAIGYVMHIAGMHINNFYSHKSYSLQFKGSGNLAFSFEAILLAGLISYYFWLYKSKISRNLALCCVPPLLIFIIFFKVGSPQYFITVLLVSIAALESLSSRDKSSLLIRLFLISSTLYLIFSFYPHLIRLNSFTTGLIIIRYLLLGELLVWSLLKIRR